MPGKAPAQQSGQPIDFSKITDPTPAQMMLRKMAGMADTDMGDRGTSVEDLNVILNASDEDFWDSDERASINAKSLSGCIIEITGFDVKYGAGAVGDDDIKTPFINPANGQQMYLLVYSVMSDKSQQNKLYALPDNGEEFQWNTSARYIVAKLMSAHSRGWLDNGKPPMRVRIVGTAIGGKRVVEKLKPADRPYVASALAQNGSDEPPF